jgi:putative tryptophan/tyrosine transport system substrate-binding protein
MLLRRLDTSVIANMLHLFLPRVDRILLYCVAGLMLFSNPARAEPLLVSVVLSENGGSYKEFSDALRESLLNSNVTLNVLDATQAPPNSSLIVTVGMKAAITVANSNAQRVLNVMIPKSGHKKLLRDFPKRENSPLFSTIYLDQPFERQLNLIAAAFPERNRIGVLFDTPPPDDLDQLREKIRESGLNLYEQEVATHTSVFEALQNVLLHSDVLLALPVPAVYNGSTLRNILVSTYQAEIPLVGFSSAYVKAGAICAVFSTPAQFASQTSLAIQKFIETGALTPTQYPKFYEVAVNDRVAQSLKINIKSPDEILRRMNTIKRRLP